MKCVNVSNLFAYKNRLVPEGEQRRIEQHIESCFQCKDALENYEKFAKLILTSPPDAELSESPDCLDDFSLLSYLEGEISGKSRKQFYYHFSQCERCTGRVVQLENFLYELRVDGLLPVQGRLKEQAKAAVEETIRSAKKKLKPLSDISWLPRPAYGWVGVAAILIVAGLSLLHNGGPEKMPLTTRERTTTEPTSEIKLLTPTNRGVASGPNLKFRWAGDKDIATFTFTLINSDGDILWEKRTEESEVMLPADLNLRPSSTYFWQVEASLRAGGSLISDMANFIYDSR